MYPLIIDTKVLKRVIRQFKSKDGFWRVVGQPDVASQEDSNQFLPYFNQYYDFVSQNAGKVCPGISHCSLSIRSDSGSCVW